QHLASTLVVTHDPHGASAHGNAGRGDAKRVFALPEQPDRHVNEQSSIAGDPAVDEPGAGRIRREHWTTEQAAALRGERHPCRLDAAEAVRDTIDLRDASAVSVVDPDRIVAYRRHDRIGPDTNDGADLV